MKTISQLILLTAFAALPVFLPACGGPSDEHVKNQELRVALYDNPTNLDPRTQSDAVSFRVIELTYDFLVRMDSTGLPELDLAEKLENPSDAEYIFTLRRNVRFHDGSPLSAYDVAYTFDSILDPALNAPLRSTLEIVKQISVLDSFTVKFELKTPRAPFLSDLVVGIVSEKAAREGKIDLNRTPLGSGPFKFRRWDQNAFIELEANREYWRGSPRLNKIVLKILPEATTRILALENGEVDLIVGNISESYLPNLEKNKRLKVVKGEGSNYVYLALNLENPYLKKREVRQAIAHALDVEGMIASLLSGVHRQAGSLLNEKNWACNPNIKPYPYDPPLARKLLDDAGFPDPDGDGPLPRFSLQYKCTANLLSRQKAQVVQQHLKEVGIEVKVQSHEWATFFEDVRSGRFDLYSLTSVGVYEPAIYENFYHSRSIATQKNRVGYRNPEMDRLIDLAGRTLDPGQRKQYYWRIQEIAREDLPYLDLWHETIIAAMDRRLTGFEIYPAGEWRSFYKMRFEDSSGD